MTSQNVTACTGLVQEIRNQVKGIAVLSIKQMAAMSGLTVGRFYCGRSNGSLRLLRWVETGNAVFATEESFFEWQATRAAMKQERADRRQARAG